jgi:hypothetical protein
MKKLLYASVLLCLAGSTTNAQTRNVPAGTGGYSSGYTTPNIIGGSAVSMSQVPYQVSMKIGGSHACGGSIIADRWILTAAHCVVLGGATTSNTTIQAGHADQTSPSGQYRNVSAIYVHPSYNVSTNENDVALLYLSAPLSFNNDVMPVEYANMCNTTTADITPPTSALLSGWGLTCNSCGVSQFLNAVTMPLTTQSNAMFLNTSYNPGFTANVSANMLPFYNPGSGAAPGDSGGPAVIDKNGNKINLGASSWGYYPKDQLPTIYTNIRNYATWIEGITGFSFSVPGAVDLYSKDKPWDMGVQPSNVNYLWESEDIWVRNQNDGILNQVHENPEHYTLPSNSNYIYVRVRNRGCVASSGTNKVKLYWAKAATALSWPNHWNGTLSVGGNSLGDYIGEYTLSTIQPGDAEIATIPWNAPDPADYVGLSSDPLVFAEEPHHFCIVARIESTVDPIGIETSDLGGNVNNNNNIVWKNLTVVDDNPTNMTPFSANVLVGNAWERRGTYDLIFANPDYYTGNPITKEAEIRITLDAPLWRKWREGGMQADGIRVANADKFQVVLTGRESGTLKNITLAPGERYLVNTTVNFLAAAASDKTEFGFNILQRNVESGRIVGGEQYTVLRKGRNLFAAKAGGNKEITRDESATLNAFPIAEQAVYNWYDQSGKLIYTGKDFNVSPAVTTKYKLEVIAKADGFKDYTEVEVKVKQNFIKGVFPNPSNGNGTININYDATQASSAYLMLVPLNTGISNQFILNTKQNTKTIDISDYAPGQYAIVLVCNGEVADYKTTAIN